MTNPTNAATAPARADGPDVALSLDQFLGAWRAMCEAAPAAVFDAGDGVDYLFSGLPIPFFNIALVSASGVTADRLRAQGRTARAWAAPHGVPWFFVVTHERLAAGVEPDAALGEADLVPALPLTGMVAEGLTTPAENVAGLQLAIPTDEGALASLADINGAAYGMDLEPSKVMIGSPRFWAGHVPALGSVDGTPASCAAVLMIDGLRYVAMVATEPAHQRRGYGHVVMQHALATAAARYGASTTVLHATDAGRPVYERMGYRTVSTHTLYIDKAFAH